MSEWYDKDGTPISDMMTWAKKIEDRSYKRVAETTLSNGKWVSTVWLGLNHQYGDGPPLIFETMVFKSKNDMNELDIERYSTLEEAKAGHERMVGKWSLIQGDSEP